MWCLARICVGMHRAGSVRREALGQAQYQRPIRCGELGYSGPELLATVQYFVDEEGWPRRHRRRGSDIPAAPAGAW